MPLESSSTRYGSVAIAIHWLSAVLIIAALEAGFLAANALDAAVKAEPPGFHATAAGAVAKLTIAPLPGWWFTDRNPDPVEAHPKGRNPARWQFIGCLICRFRHDRQRHLDVNAFPYRAVFLTRMRTGTLFRRSTTTHLTQL